jgi:hypothetical protein
MTIIFDSAATVNVSTFGHGVPVRRLTGPTARDMAFELGRELGLEFGRPVDPPASYTAAERAAFRDGQVEAMAVLEAREVDHLSEMAEKDAHMTAVCNGHIL